MSSSRHKVQARYMSNKDIFQLDMYNYEGEFTLGGFLKNCLRELLIRQEGFSGKRPVGNSDWYCCLCVTLAINELIDAELEIEGDESSGDIIEVIDYDDEAADKKLLELVDHIFKHGANIEN